MRLTPVTYDWCIRVLPAATLQNLLDFAQCYMYTEGSIIFLRKTRACAKIIINSVKHFHPIHVIRVAVLYARTFVWVFTQVGQY